MSPTAAENEQQNDLQAIGSALKWLYSLLPIGYLVILVTSYFSGHMEIVYAMPAVIVITGIAYFMVKRNHLQASVAFFLVSILLVVTVINTMDQGLHDAGILTYTAILVMATLMLRLRDQILITIVILLCISWLALGDKYGLYTPAPVTQGTWAELIVILVIIGLSTLICYRIANRLRGTLIKAEKEVQRRRVRSDELISMVESKMKLTNAIHGQVSNSLSIIREIMEHQTADEPLIESLSDQILTIEVIHSELHRLGEERELNLGDYLQALSAAQPKNYENLKITLSNPTQVNIEQAMSVGLLVNEICHDQKIKGELILSSTEKSLKLQLTIDAALIELSALADIMIRQVRGELSFNGSRTEMYLHVSKSGK